MPRQARLDAPETLHHIIVRCDEDAYFTELVRYIHLNPLRAGVVKTLA